MPSNTATTDKRPHWGRIAVGLAGLSIGYMAAASAAPWPVYGVAGFIWGAGLVAVAIGYAVKRRHHLPPGGLKWGLVLAVLGWFVPLVLN